MLDWSLNSSNLNPIKNLWFILKRRVEKNINKLVIEKKSVTVKIFCKTIQQEWNKIEPKIFINLICSMPTRLEQIIKHNVNKINY